MVVTEDKDHAVAASGKLTSTQQQVTTHIASENEYRSTADSQQ